MKYLVITLVREDLTLSSLPGRRDYCVTNVVTSELSERVLRYDEKSSASARFNGGGREKEIFPSKDTVEEDGGGLGVVVSSIV